LRAGLGQEIEPACLAGPARFFNRAWRAGPKTGRASPGSGRTGPGGPFGHLYLPHHFALGPYHCDRPELRDMERYKLAAAKRAERLFAEGHKLDHLVQCLLQEQDKIRAPYHRYGCCSALLCSALFLVSGN
jgi:hypothetical protein